MGDLLSTGIKYVLILKGEMSGKDSHVYLFMKHKREYVTCLVKLLVGGYLQ